MNMTASEEIKPCWLNLLVWCWLRITPNIKNQKKTASIILIKDVIW